jgi:zinc/manganese transport system substrate-binding protein
MFRLFFAFTIFGIVSLPAAVLKIAVLHPLLGDIARNVGGDQVEVISLIGPNGDPHHFEPTAEDLKQADQAKIFFIAGMGLEGYLPKLRGILAGKATLIDVSASFPRLKGEHNEDERETSHDDEIDPHWWHSIELFRRATTVITDALCAEDPHDRALFLQNAVVYRNRLDELESWSRREISKIPRNQRQLATAHAAFNYFCKDFGFTAYPVQGLNREQMPDPRNLVYLIESLRKNHVMAIFPEKESNPKILETLTHDTGIRIAPPLIADGVGGKTYGQMYRYNVNTIVTALSK